MSDRLEIHFAALTAGLGRATAILAGPDLKGSRTLSELDERSGGALTRAAAAADYAGKAKSVLEILAPPKLTSQRLILIGADTDAGELDRLKLGGLALAQLQARKCDSGHVIVDFVSDGADGATWAADIALGALLRSYAFKKYQTKKNDDEGNGPKYGLTKLTIHCAKPDAAAESFKARGALAAGVFLARDLVNEPANVLGPVEFADRIAALRSSGLDVEILEPAELEKLGMRALLGVAQGSAKPARVAVMQWHGSKSKRAKPLCFVGKGVTFDTGGFSIKPGAGMEDMKGDMGGAACVAGLMLALAGRKAPVNAVGIVGLVENMPSATAQRPGDIVTSMSGQTIEILNTDAEGRLVLADILWYAQERFKPRFVVDLATLTGAIMVALGKAHAGLFSNDDKLSGDLARAGEATGEKVWRMPLGKDYDKLIDTPNADMKNIGGRFGGSITAAQFIQRFIKDTPWAHLDIAGTAMDSGKNEINQSWGSGWGVRLLDRLISDVYEKPEKG